MLHVTDSNFHENLFKYLDYVASGETIIIMRNDVEVARVVGSYLQTWRARVPNLKLLVEPDQLIEPIEDVWNDDT